MKQCSTPEQVRINADAGCGWWGKPDLAFVAKTSKCLACSRLQIVAARNPQANGGIYSLPRLGEYGMITASGVVTSPGAAKCGNAQCWTTRGFVPVRSQTGCLAGMPGCHLNSRSCRRYGRMVQNLGGLVTAPVRTLTEGLSVIWSKIWCVHRSHSHQRSRLSLRQIRLQLMMSPTGAQYPKVDNLRTCPQSIRRMN